MKFVFATLLLILAGCSSTAPHSSANSSETAETPVEETIPIETPVRPKLSSMEDVLPEEPAELMEYVGLVHVNKLGCGILIQVSLAEQRKMLTPKNLAKEFHKQDMLVTFTFRESSDPKPSGCKSDGVIEIVTVRSN